jgi:hypothetical protein
VRLVAAGGYEIGEKSRLREDVLYSIRAVEKIGDTYEKIGKKSEIHP